jgi:hypothetical protein
VLTVMETVFGVVEVLKADAPKETNVGGVATAYLFLATNAEEGGLGSVVRNSSAKSWLSS